MTALASWTKDLWTKDTFEEPTEEAPFRFIDLRLSGGGVIRATQGSLSTNQVEDWVKEVGKFERKHDDNGGLRLLVGTARNEQRHILKPWPFSPEMASTVFQEFDLMETFFHACKTGNRLISVRSSQPGSQDKPSWMLRQAHHAAAVSYSMHTNRVCGVVLAGGKKQEKNPVKTQDDFAKAQEDFVNEVLKLKEYACHPLLVPWIVLNNEAERLDTERGVDNSQVLEIEKKTGLRKHSYTDEEFTNEVAGSMQKIVERLAMISNHKADTEILEKNFKDAIPRSIQVFQDDIKLPDSDSPDKEALLFRDGAIMAQMQRHSRDFERRFKYLFDCNTSTAASFKALQKRVVAQMEGLFMMYTHQNNKLTQHNNALNLVMAKDSRWLASASKRDSSSMKIIAFITTLFIPATFIATVFGMNTVNLQFWIYLAIAIPLTIVVMVLMLATMRYLDSGNERAGKEAEQQVEVSLKTKNGQEPARRGWSKLRSLTNIF